MFDLYSLDPSNSGSGGAAMLGTYRTSDEMADVLAAGYFDAGAANLKNTKVLFVFASDAQGFVLIDSNGETVTATEYNPSSGDYVTQAQLDQRLSSAQRSAIDALGPESDPSDIVAALQA